MTFVVQIELRPPYVVSGNWKDFNEKVPDIRDAEHVATTFKWGDRFLNPEQTPKHLLLDPPIRRPPDSFKTDSGAMVISDRMRALIEEMDPGRHQYLPVSIDNLPNAGEWFLLNVHAKQDSVIDEKSEVKPFSGGRGNEVMKFQYLKSSEDPIGIFFRRESQSDLNMWRERRYPGSLIVSDAFDTALKESGLAFFKLRQARDV